MKPKDKQADQMSKIDEKNPRKIKKKPGGKDKATNEV